MSQPAIAPVSGGLGNASPGESETSGRALRILAPLILLAAVTVFYFPQRASTGEWGLCGLDFHQLHERRISFFQEQWRVHGRLPAWYPHEFLGSPFWANIQAFPFLPTRLILLVLPAFAVHGAGCLLAALLAAGFMHMYARRLGMDPIASATAGLTFAFSGFFASRVYAGHLPLIEVYAALP
ncbi:MAG: hypothetical protein NZ561_01245, partial [Phycisphaerae bacterium]|nr:hypothetical protein [Phycisphaerae bacterium]